VVVVGGGVVGGGVDAGGVVGGGVLTGGVVGGVVGGGGWPLWLGASRAGGLRPLVPLTMRWPQVVSAAALKFWVMSRIGSLLPAHDHPIYTSTRASAPRLSH